MVEVDNIVSTSYKTWRLTDDFREYNRAIARYDQVATKR